ncbi:MAG: hypothetical protein ACTSRS_05785 [Candidatus Helarchaeota archaeon]
MIHNLYIISEGGIAIYTKHFVKSQLDEQLISGFLLAVGNFAKEAVGSGLKKIEMETGEQLFVYYDLSTKLTAAAITGPQDHPKLVGDLLPEILASFTKQFGKKIDSPFIVEESPKFDPYIESFLADKTRKRDKKRFILGLILGTIVLILLFYLLIVPIALIAQNYVDGVNYVISSTSPEDPSRLANLLGVSAGLFFGLEVVLVILFIPSSFVAGYTAGSRSKGKWIGIAFFFFSIFLSIIFGFINVAIAILTAVLLIYLPLALFTSIALGYLGGLVRDRKKLYPLPSEIS